MNPSLFSLLQEKEKVEVVIPIYNEEECIEKLFSRLITLREKANYIEINFIFVNDGSSDKSLEMLYSYSEKYDFVKVVNFSRNFGHQMAVTAGLDYATADYVVTTYIQQQNS